MDLDADELPSTSESFIEVRPNNDGATPSTNSSDTESDIGTPGTSGDLEIADFGQKATVKRLYEGPRKCPCCINWVEQIPDDIPPPIENTEESKQHALLVRMRKSHNTEGDPLVLDSVVVQSPQLKNLLSELFKDYTGITANLKRLVFRAPFHPFFHEWKSLGSLIKQSTDQLTVAHGKLLRKLLKSELKETLAVSEDLKRNEVMMHEYLWTIFRPGVEIFSTSEGHNCIYKLISGNYVNNQKGNPFRLQLRSIDVNGALIGYARSEILIDHFAGTKPLRSLEAFPVAYHPFAADVREQLTRRGSRFRDFRTNTRSYKAHNGTITTSDARSAGKKNVNGRIVVDAEAYLSFNPNTSTPVDPLEGVTFKSPLEVYDQDQYHLMGFPGPHPHPLHANNGLPPPPPPLPPNSGYPPCGPLPAVYHHNNALIEGEEIQTPTRRDVQKGESVPLSDELLHLCNPQVKGYCLKTKKWATFYIDNIQEIKWNEEAFDSLVLPRDYKRLILSFVESQISNKKTFDDVIEGKGQGLIMLLQGSPGVGKTLTAEALADRLRKPLYTLSIGELGDHASSLESRLTTVLDICAKWDAVLLLDESDVFLEARSIDSLERNGVVAVFLRLLEYFRGILFMTTNRVHAMDPAFRSRIHLTINYPKLGKQARKQVWERLVGVESGLSKEDFEKLAEWEVNGREVKNIVKTAHLLAMHEGVELAMEHIQTVVKVTRGEIGEGDEDEGNGVQKTSVEEIPLHTTGGHHDMTRVLDEEHEAPESKRLRQI